MPNRQPAEHRHTQFSEVIVQHINCRPLAALGFGRANKLTHCHTLQTFKAPGPLKLCQCSVDSSDECINGFDQENGTGETWTDPSNGTRNHAKTSAQQNTTRGSLDKHVGRNLVWILMNNQRLRFHKCAA